MQRSFRPATSMKLISVPIFSICLVLSPFTLTAQTSATLGIVSASPSPPVRPGHSELVVRAMAQMAALDEAPPSVSIAVAALAAGSDLADHPVVTDSPSVRIDIAQRLLHIAEWFQRNGEDALALDAGSRALKHLDAAE